eukprot:TRINITY_DN15456_c0_g1_i1.p1 TRINITY_DN15456_c0_g1~~TRINITY_DN15456_c0_g1_i1.p1  ORF type:complete len:855 (-),score=120.58 TRINITY_DN15456_c0_g1_i1:357-2921(-)
MTSTLTRCGTAPGSLEGAPLNLEFAPGQDCGLGSRIMALTTPRACRGPGGVRARGGRNSRHQGAGGGRLRPLPGGRPLTSGGVDSVGSLADVAAEGEDDGDADKVVAEASRKSSRHRVSSKRMSPRDIQMLRLHGSEAAPRPNWAMLEAPRLSVQDGDDSEDSQEHAASLSENIRLRKQLHHQAVELHDAREKLRRAMSELATVRSEADELRLKLGNLERSDRVKSTALVEERRRTDDLSKQLKAMSQNLLSILQKDGASGAEATGLQKRCCKLVQEKALLSVQSGLLRRQKGWAEAKARVLEAEMTRVYLGTGAHRVKANAELEFDTGQEYDSGNKAGEGARIYRLLVPFEYQHKQTVVDFLTHISHTCGQDVNGFLRSPSVYCDSVRDECLAGLGREFNATLFQNRQLPRILRAVHRLCHLTDYLPAFESFSAEVAEILECAHAKLWVVDHVHQCLWTCTRSNVRTGTGKPVTTTLPIPRGSSSEMLAGKSLVVAACALGRTLDVADVKGDPRFDPATDVTVPGQEVINALCMPVMRRQKGNTERIGVIVQAVNKLHESKFDAEADGRILHLLGKVSMQMLEVCQENSAASMNAKRKDSLLHILTTKMPCAEPADVLQVMENGLKDTFLSLSVAVFIQHHEASLTRFQLHKDAGSQNYKVVKTMCDGGRGIASLVGKTRDHCSVASASLSNSSYDPQVDIAIPDKAALHTVPVNDHRHQECSAVVQFVVPETRSDLVGDDGSYHPGNVSHHKVLGSLLAFLRNHLAVFPPRFRDSLDYDPNELNLTRRRSTDDAAYQHLDRRNSCPMPRDGDEAREEGHAAPLARSMERPRRQGASSGGLGVNLTTRRRSVM